MILRKVTKNHRIFPNDQAAMKVIYLAIGNLSKKWTMPFAQRCEALPGLEARVESICYRV